MPRKYELFWQILILCIVVVGTNVAGNYALARGMHHIGVISLWSPGTYVKAVFHFWVGTGAVLMVIWLIARLALLSWADLSYVLLVTSFSYALSAAAGVIGLHEDVSWTHWGGICLITLGVLLVARTYPRTTGSTEAGK